MRRRVRFFLEEKLQFWPLRITGWTLGGAGKFLCYFWGLASCGWFLQWWTLPLSLYYSNTWVWTQCLFQLIFVPLCAIFLPLCLALFLTYWLPVGPIWVAGLRLFSNIFSGLLLSLQRFAWVDYLRQPEPAELAAYFLLFLAIYYSPWRLWGRSTRPLAFLTPVLFFIILRLGSAPPDGKLQITMLDVGQGESIHIRYPDGSDALVDTGGFLSPGRATSSQVVGRRLVSRYLWKERSGHLQYVLLTHAHADHTQGYDFLRRAFPIRQLFLHDLREQYRGPSVRILSAGDRFCSGRGSTFRPPPTGGRSLCGCLEPQSFFAGCPAALQGFLHAFHRRHRRIGGKAALFRPAAPHDPESGTPRKSLQQFPGTAGSGSAQAGHHLCRTKERLWASLGSYFGSIGESGGGSPHHISVGKPKDRNRWRQLEGFPLLNRSGQIS